MTKRKRPSLQKKVSKITCIQDVIDMEEGVTSYQLRNRSGRVLTKQSKQIFQKYDRDVLSGLTQRWINRESCPSLTTFNVKIHDNVAMLPLGGPNDRRDYANLYDEFLVKVYGKFNRNFKAFKDIHEKLQDLDLTLKEFKNMYFHPFHQSEQELSEFPAYVINNARHRKVQYEDEKERCHHAYNAWDKKFYPRNIDLINVVKVDELLLTVYEKGSYINTSWCEALLVRNIITHLNQWKLQRDGDIFDKIEVLEILFERFPGIHIKLFDFCQFCRVDLDFQQLRKFLKA